MKEIVETLWKPPLEKPALANAITLETVGKILDCIREFGIPGNGAGPGGRRRWNPWADIMPKAQSVYVAAMQYPADGGTGRRRGEIQWQKL